MGNTINSKNVPILKSLAVAASVLVVSAWSGFSQGAVATISYTSASGGFDYTVLLQNTGTTNLNSFWYGWTQSGNNLPSDPSNAGNSLGWDNNLAFNSIMWINSTGTALAPGQFGSFTFFSADTPAAITTSPSGESVAYVGGITGSQDAPGDSTPVFSPVLTPEPSPASLLSAGALGLLVVGRILNRRKQAPSA